jgi:hypothetical protein
VELDGRPPPGFGQASCSGALSGVSSPGAGDQMLLNPSATAECYEATFSIALDLSDTEIGADDDAFQIGGGQPGGDGTPPPGGPPTS